jgi:hypothetical protein
MQVTPIFSHVAQFIKNGLDKIVVYAGRIWRTLDSSNNRLIVLTVTIMTLATLILYRRRSNIAKVEQIAHVKDSQNSYRSLSSIPFQQPAGQTPETFPNASIQKMQSNTLIETGIPRDQLLTESPSTESILEVWVRQGDSSENREEASKRIKAFLSYPAEDINSTGLNLINPALVDLDLKELNLKELPQIFHDPRFSQRPRIDLHLQGNQLKNLNNSIRFLTNLNLLNLNSNNLENLPSFIGNFANLKLLFIGNNPRLRNLPSSLSKSPKLTFFAAGQTSIPKNQEDAIYVMCQARMKVEAQACSLFQKLKR